MKLIERVQDILLKPKETWVAIKEEEMTVKELYTSYAVILAAIPAVAYLIGMSVIGLSFPGFRSRAPLGEALTYGVVSYLLSLVALYIVALVIDTVAPKFGAEKNMNSAMKLAIYSWTPSWIAGVLLIIPNLSTLAMICSLYGFYLFYVGLPVLMNPPAERVRAYFAVIVVITVIISAFIGAIAGLIFFPAGML